MKCGQKVMCKDGYQICFVYTLKNPKTGKDACYLPTCPICGRAHIFDLEPDTLLDNHQGTRCHKRGIYRVIHFHVLGAAPKAIMDHLYLSFVGWEDINGRQR